MTTARAALAAAAGLLVLTAAVAVALGPPARAHQALGPGSVERGEALYVASCATCHGRHGEGVSPWPAIEMAGAAAADFQLRTGRMPFAGRPGEQAQAKPPAYDEQEIRDLVAYVASLGDGPGIPHVETDEALLSEGQRLFQVNCAPCHGATANGGAVGGGAIAPPLGDSPPVIVAEAMITGPGEMPVFALPPEQLNAVVTYTEYLRTAADPGGLAIGGIGPVPEGFVAWLVGMGLLGLIVYLVGREWDRKGNVA